MSASLHQIPTTLLLGFLGSGKTTAILDLIRRKPSNETWAVLVNEFGQIGIDGAIYRDRGIAVSEIAGGCMCCASGAPMNVSITRLLRQARPDRLLIETSGLGHPRRIIQMLTTDEFCQVLEPRASICLLDPRHLAQPKYREHENFIDQIQVADILIANKTDLASAHELALFDQWAEHSDPAKSVTAKTQNGKLDPAWLDMPRRDLWRPSTTIFTPARNPQETSFGWKFPAAVRFKLACLQDLLRELNASRVKGILHTNQGWLIINGAESADFTPTDASADSRIEIIGADIDRENLYRRITACTD